MLPPRKRLCIDLGPRFKIRRDPNREIGYGITDVWEDPDEIAEEIPATNMEELSQRMTDFVTTFRHDIYEIYGRLDDAQDKRLLMSVSSTRYVKIGAPMLTLLDLWRVRPELLVRLGYSIWMPVIWHVLREDRPEVTLPPRKRLDIALGPRYEVEESSSAAAARPAGGLRADYGFVATVDREIMRDTEREVGYGIIDSWDEIVETLQGAPVSTDTELGGYVREFETRVRQDTDEIYMKLDDEQTERQLLAGRLNILFRDRRIGDSPTGIGDSFVGTGYYITRTAWTRWRSYTVRAARGGWWQYID
nr:hypothetical protein [Tanacetum cinerariifolium]